jgi:hypothetical protein
MIGFRRPEFWLIRLGIFSFPFARRLGNWVYGLGVGREAMGYRLEEIALHLRLLPAFMLLSSAAIGIFEQELPHRSDSVEYEPVPYRTFFSERSLSNL